MSEQRVLPRWFYDRIDRQAAKYGGIGVVDFYRDFKPNCVHGLFWGQIGRPLHLLSVFDSIPRFFGVPDSLECDGISADAGCSYRGRVAFAAWCKAGGIVRGK